MSKEQLIKHFEGLEDKRYKGFVKHELWKVLGLVMCATLSGIDTLSEIVDYGNERLEFLNEEFGIDKIPSKSTLTRVLNAVNGDEVAECVLRIMRDAILADGEIAALDGKSIRHTYHDKRCEITHIVSAYCTKTGVTLGQKRTKRKQNEIPVLRELLQLFDISNRIVTADAMHCQRETVNEIVKRGGKYVLPVKRNQRSFYMEIEDHFLFSDEETLEVYETTEVNRGRDEDRKCIKSTDNKFIQEHSDWNDLQSVFMIERFTIKKGKSSLETTYYISNLDVSAEKMLKIVREHWQIEAMHYMLDVSFGEDSGRVLSNNGQTSLNAFRKLAIAIHKNYLEANTKTKTKPSIKSHMFKTLISNSLLPDLVSFSNNL